MLTTIPPTRRRAELSPGILSKTTTTKKQSLECLDDTKLHGGVSPCRPGEHQKTPPMGRSTPLSSTAVPVRLPPVPRQPWCRPGGGQSLATAWAARLPGQRGLSRLVPCVRCLRCPPRPPLPGPQSRAWSREPEAPPALGHPALPGRRPAPAPSPGLCPMPAAGMETFWTL